MNPHSQGAHFHRARHTQKPEVGARTSWCPDEKPQGHMPPPLSFALPREPRQLASPPKPGAVRPTKDAGSMPPSVVVLVVPQFPHCDCL